MPAEIIYLADVRKARADAAALGVWQAKCALAPSAARMSPGTLLLLEFMAVMLAFQLVWMKHTGGL